MWWTKVQNVNDVLRIVKEYTTSTGQYSFTYADLRAWYYGTGAHKRYKKDWHTIERMLRRAAEEGHLVRYRYKRTVRFIPANEKQVWKLREKYVEAVNKGDHNLVRRVIAEAAKELGLPEHDAYLVLSRRLV